MSEASIDRLLERVRELQRLLPAGDDIGGGAPQHSPLPPPGLKRAETEMASPRAGTPKASGAEDLAQLQAATLQLLSQVTFVRVVMERLYWDRCPATLAKQVAAKNKSPRDKGSILLEYQFPFLDSDPETLKKRVKAFAKTILPTVIHFNHRRVALLKMTERLYRLWAGSSLWIRLYMQSTDLDGKTTMRQIGRCQVELMSLLQLPFSLETMALVEGVGEWSGSRGRLQLTLQLGSRNTAFADRLEAAGSELTHPPELRRSMPADLNPAAVHRHLRSLPSEAPPTVHRHPSPPTKLYEDEVDQDPFSPRSSGRTSFRPTYDTSTPPPDLEPRHLAPRSPVSTNRNRSEASGARTTQVSAGAQTDADSRPLPPPPPPMSPQRPADANNTFTFGLSKTLEHTDPPLPAATSSPIKLPFTFLFDDLLRKF